MQFVLNLCNTYTEVSIIFNSSSNLLLWQQLHCSRFTVVAAVALNAMSWFLLYAHMLDSSNFEVHFIDCHQLYAWTYVCMYVCMHVCTYVCMYVCMHVCTYVCMYVCVYVRMYVMYVCMYVRMYVRTCVCITVVISWSLYHASCYRSRKATLSLVYGI